MRYLTDLAVATNATAYRTYAQRQSDRIWQSGKDPLNRVGVSWTGQATNNPRDWRTQASALSAVAVANGRDDSPLQRVKLDTARAHILLADNATRDYGLALLERSRTHAMKHKLTHQVASIDRISRLAHAGNSQQRVDR